MIPNPSTFIEPSEADHGAVDAIALLVADHDDVEEMFIEYHELVRDEGTDAARVVLAEQICQALTAHATLEEELFYPAARDALGDPGLIEKAEQEHAAAKALMEQLQGMSASDDLYDNTVLQLQEAVEQHVQDEEEDLFPQLRGTSLDVLALGMRMAERKEELLSQAEEEEGADD